MDSSEINDALDVLRQFMHEMHEWESKYYKQKMEIVQLGGDTGELDKEAATGLEAILDRWALRDSSNRGRLTDMGVSSPPAYNPKLDPITGNEVAGRDLLVYTEQHAGLRSRFRFTMQSSPQGWKIKRKDLLNHREKWQRSPL